MPLIEEIDGIMVYRVSHGPMEGQYVAYFMVNKYRLSGSFIRPTKEDAIKAAKEAKRTC